MLINIATANPPYKVSQIKATEELKKRMAVRPAVARMIDAASAHSGIDFRYFVVPDGDEESKEKFYSTNGEYIKPGTQRRMLEYEKWSKELTKTAVRKLLDESNVDPSQINRLITISCTGFFAPGLDHYLMTEFGIPLSARRTNVGFMGCAASLIGFNSVLEAINSSNEKEVNALVVSVELCSLHLQTDATRDNILANMIFADGSAAALFSNSLRLEEKKRMNLLSADSIMFENTSEFMGWKIGDFGFEMMLSSELPKIILEKAIPALQHILSLYGLSPGQVHHWVLHPGGRAILDSLQSGLNLSEDKMEPSRNVLRNYGNMSSASILFVLKELINAGVVNKDEYCCAVAFGPGLTMEVAMFKGA